MQPVLLLRNRNMINIFKIYLMEGLPYKSLCKLLLRNDNGQLHITLRYKPCFYHIMFHSPFQRRLALVAVCSFHLTIFNMLVLYVFNIRKNIFIELK